jgi:hypothetical protein
VSEFLAAATVPWTRILADDGVTLDVRTTLRPAEGVKIYCPDGSFTIDGRIRDNQRDVIRLENAHIYMANFLLRVPLGNINVGNNPYVGMSIMTSGADLIYLQSFSIDAPGAGDENTQADAPETFHIWNSEGASGRVTLDQYEIITNPSWGSKCFLIGGGDSSRVHVTMVHGICRSFQRGPKVDDGATLDFVNNVVPTVVRYTAIDADVDSTIHVRASFIHLRTNTSWGSEIKVRDSSAVIVLGPEPNFAYPGVTLQSYGSGASTPPYPTPAIWDEATIMANLGAGTTVLPE